MGWGFLGGLGVLGFLGGGGCFFKRFRSIGGALGVTCRTIVWDVGFVSLCLGVLLHKVR